MDNIQKALIKIGRKDLAQEYYFKVKSNKNEAVYAEDIEGNKYRVLEIGVSWAAIIPEEGGFSDKIKIPVGDFYEEYKLYDSRNNLVHDPEDVED